MNRGLQGRYSTVSTVGEEVKAFIPAPLPPDPPLLVSGEILELSEKAQIALGRLDGVSSVLPDTSLFLYFYVRKEAVLSSQIEGTQSSLSDLLMYESEEVPGVPFDDVEEVSQYVAALNHGLKRLQDLPLSLRLLKEVHAVLLSKGRGSTKTPGEFRRSQNWIGGTRPGNAAFVPPPHEEVIPCLGTLEKFLHNDPVRVPVLMKAALAHVQFETIHPFQDGNGRLGRLLITFLLCSEGVLNQPLLYLSLFFKAHRSRYYELLQKARMEGEWEEWYAFFLEGIAFTAHQASETARKILDLFGTDERRITELGRRANTALRVHHYLRRNPIISIPKAAKLMKLSQPSITGALRDLTGLELVREVTGRRRGKIFVYRAYLDLLDEGTEPEPKA